MNKINEIFTFLTKSDELQRLTHRLAKNRLGPVPQKPINANLRLKINQAVYFSTPKCCSTQIFGRTLHEKTLILKNKYKQKKLSPKS